jgi:glycosyltransferase involved in cell wall biosynthesis
MAADLLQAPACQRAGYWHRQVGSSRPPRNHSDGLVLVPRPPHCGEGGCSRGARQGRVAPHNHDIAGRHLSEVTSRSAPDRLADYERPGEPRRARPRMTATKVIFDLVAAQSPSYRGRGVARYSTDFALAITAHHPELVGAVVLHPELEVPEPLGDLAKWVSTEPNWDEAAVLHISSAFEPEVPVSTYWPREAARHGLLTAVTLYDLIPDLFPGWYLEDPGLRRRWRCCREVVRAADRVLTLSESARRDAISLLGIPEARVITVGTGTSSAFCRPQSRDAAFELARAGVEGLEKGFVVYNGAFNPRKNLDRLLEAYATLPREIVDAHQLVVVGEAPPLTRNHYLVMAERLGVGGRVLIPGFVPEEVLVALYQSATLAVYPSLYEGYGLPLIESLACGAPTIAGNNSSLSEVLPREALFEAQDAGAIAEAMLRALTDERFRAKLLSLTERPLPRWQDVADRAAAVFEEMLRLASKLPPRWRKRPQLAVVAPPASILGALGELASCDTFSFAGSEKGALAWRTLPALDRWRGGYDAVVFFPSGNSDRQLKQIGRFGATWRGLSIAVAKGTSSPKVSKLSRAGVKVLQPAASPAATAKLVLEALGFPHK